MANITEITNDNFEELIDQGGIVVIDWWAGWCNPCMMFAPVYDAASDRHPDIVWGKVNTEEQPELARAFQVMSIPTLMVFRDGLLLFEQAGIIPGPKLDELVENVKALDIDEVRAALEKQQAEADAAEKEAFGEPDEE